MQIIGLCLVKNEEFYIGQVITNIIDFCDKIIVLDNQSEDKTYQIVDNLAREYNSIELVSIADFSESHSFVESYAGTDTWIFGVDGDELYDPQGLKELRAKLLAHEYQSYFMLRGHFFHCIDLDLNEKKAVGYLAPPSNEVTKLFNFSLLSSWKSSGKWQRLSAKHGTIIPEIYQTIYQSKEVKKKLNYYKLIYRESDWENSCLRCFHLRFIPRTPLEETNKSINPRLNPTSVQSKANFQERRSYMRGGIKEICGLENFFDENQLNPKNGFPFQKMMNLNIYQLIPTYLRVKGFIYRSLKKIYSSDAEF